MLPHGTVQREINSRNDNYDGNDDAADARAVPSLRCVSVIPAAVAVSVISISIIAIAVAIAGVWIAVIPIILRIPSV